jgi:dienelactone hydrolase
MPPKRRKSTDPPSAPEPKKQATRRSTRSKAPVIQKAHTESPEPTIKPPSKVTKGKESAKSKESATKEPAAKEGSTPLTIKTDKKSITCLEYSPASISKKDTPTLIFTHGAGGTLAADAVVNFCTGYSTLAPILAFKGSMNLASRVKDFHACLSHLAETQGKSKTIVLGGRSMGARAAVITATELLAESREPKPQVSLILVSYPLKGPKDVRDQILYKLLASVKVLFIVGDRDAMCPSDLLDDVRMDVRMKAKSKVVVVKGADHGMHVKPAAKEKEFGEETGKVAAEWVSGGSQAGLGVGNDEIGGKEYSDSDSDW